MSEHIDNVNCTGTESKLNDCHYDIISNLGFYYSVGVICQDGKCEVDKTMSKFPCLYQAWLQAFLAMCVHAFSILHIYVIIVQPAR